MSDPRKHHYLPQFYLRQFSTDSESLYQIEKQTGSFYGCKIRDMAAIRDFHEIDGDDIEDPFALERMLAAIESDLSLEHSALLRDGIKNEQAVGHCISLLSLLRMRVPAVKKHYEESLESKTRIVAENLEKNGKLPPPPPGFEENLKVKNLIFDIFNWKLMELMFGMATNPEVIDIFAGMRVTLLRAPDECLFFTCDQPVAVFYPEFDPSGVGPSTKGIEISLPLSSTALLKLDHLDGNDEERLATKDEMTEFNRRTVVMAEKYLFSSSREAEIANWAHRSRNINAGFRFTSHKTLRGTYQIQYFQAVGLEFFPGTGT
jgi:Protein of unknown function (DUF4238)